MITEKDIKPIPNYIIELVKKQDKKDYPNGDKNRRFYAYLTKYNGELAKVTVAVKNYHKDWYIKQVAVHGIHNENCFVKDMEYYLISGYVVGWYEQGLQKYRKYYESEKWYEAYDKYYDPFAYVVNPEFALKFKGYKYSQVDKYHYCNIFKYLRLYEQYPQAEYLMKLDLVQYATSKMILKKIAKDKQFRNWIIRNKEELKAKSLDIQAIFYAYKRNKTLTFASQVLAYRRSIKTNSRFQEILKLFNGNIEQFFIYMEKQNTTIASYLDYKDACEFLGLDMNIEKNKIPHDFQRWHDIRIDEMHSKQAELDKKKRKELYNNFAKVSKKYQVLQRKLKDTFITLIAKSPNDLVNEGEKLHHCVGRMNYDQKFAREESLIFFIRTKEQPDIPLVTLEYSPTTHKILQCYADHDTKPSEDIENYVNKIWLPYANRKIRQIAI